MFKVLTFACLSVGLVQCEGSAKYEGEQRPIQIIAHRGGSDLAPENTLQAFVRGIDAGSDMIEFDVRITKDGELMVMHDPTLSRTTNVEQFAQLDPNISKTATDDLAGLDAGSWFDRAFAGASVPSLRHSLEVTCVKNALVERKSGSATKYAQDLPHDSCIVVQAFDWNFLAELSGLRPDLRLVALGKGALDELQLQRLKATHVKGISWRAKDLDAQMVATAQNSGLTVFAYTVNDRRKMLDLIAMGVDGLITDVPDIASQLR